VGVDHPVLPTGRQASASRSHPLLSLRDASGRRGIFGELVTTPALRATPPIPDNRFAMSVQEGSGLREKA
jgi:hypothetical protein